MEGMICDSTPRQLNKLDQMCLQIIDLVDQLPPAVHMDVLDALQALVTKVVTKMKPGCITAVKFMLETQSEEVEDVRSLLGGTEEQEDMPPADIQIKEEILWDEEDGDADAMAIVEEGESEECAEPVKEPPKPKRKSKRKKQTRYTRKKSSAKKKKSLKKKHLDYDNKKYKCPKCPYATDEKYCIDVHLLVHTKDKIFECKTCNKTFSAVSTLKRHLMAHEGIKPYGCEICGKRFIDSAALRSHFVVHTGERAHKCNICGKAYTNDGNLRRHKRVHTGEMPYKCTKCDASFRDHSSLKLHILKHTGEKPFKCSICDKLFKTASDYKRHERTHTGEKKYGCKQCGRMFVQGWHLKQHERMHADYRPWECTLCGKKLRTKASLIHHEKGHAGVKDFECSICKKRFTTLRYLHNHQVIHTKAKPYKCKFCGTAFNQISNMKRHMKIHSDTKPYKCKYCNKKFKYINSLQYHEGIHTGHMNICEKCGYQCRCIASMKKHKCPGNTGKAGPVKYKTVNLPVTKTKKVKKVKEMKTVDKKEVDFVQEEQTTSKRPTRLSAKRAKMAADEEVNKQIKTEKTAPKTGRVTKAKYQKKPLLVRIKVKSLKKVPSKKRAVAPEPEKAESIPYDEWVLETEREAKPCKRRGRKARTEAEPVPEMADTSNAIEDVDATLKGIVDKGVTKRKTGGRRKALVPRKRITRSAQQCLQNEAYGDDIEGVNKDLTTDSRNTVDEARSCAVEAVLKPGNGLSKMDSDDDDIPLIAMVKENNVDARAEKSNYDEPYDESCTRNVFQDSGFMGDDHSPDTGSGLCIESVTTLQPDSANIFDPVMSPTDADNGNGALGNHIVPMETDEDNPGEGTNNTNEAVSDGNNGRIIENGHAGHGNGAVYPQITCEDDYVSDGGNSRCRMREDNIRDIEAGREGPCSLKQSSSQPEEKEELLIVTVESIRSKPAEHDSRM